MKLNKIFLGLGVMAIAFTSCSDEVEYTPAAPVASPAAYFSMSDATTIDFEETDTEFQVPIYRSTTDGAATVNIATKLTDEDGQAVPDGLFTYPSTVTFADGESVAYYTATFSIPNLTPMLTYVFDLDLAGDSSDYFLTKVAYNVNYTPWQKVSDCILYDNTIFQPFGGEEGMWDVDVYQHPNKKNFFRIRAPYSSGPFAYMYRYDEDPNNWLYINAGSESDVFFSDNKGNPIMWYNTGCYCDNESHFAEDYGWIQLGCYFSAYLLDEDLMFGSAGGYKWTEDWAQKAGSFKGQPSPNDQACGIISFGDNLALYLTNFANYDDLNDSGATWEVWLNGASNDPWEDMGMTTYTDGFVGPFLTLLYEGSFTVPAMTYSVPIQQNKEKPGFYRLVNPYSSNYWDYGYEGDEVCNIVIDASNPEMVIVDWQTAYPAEGDDKEISIVNAAAFYMQYTAGDKKTEDQIMAEGLNDTMEGNTITIKHPMGFYGNSGSALWLEDDFVAAVIEIPDGQSNEDEGEESAAAKARKPFNTDKVRTVKPFGKLRATNLR